MKKNYVSFLISFMLVSLTTGSYAQISLYSNGFEGTDEDTYNLTTSTGANIDFGNFAAADYILRGNPANNTLLVVQPTGFEGSNVIMWEDFDGYLAGNGELYITSHDIDISGAVNMSISLKIGVTNNTADRYETNDIIVIEYQIDSGAWVTVGDFRGVINGNTFNFYEDDDLNGTFTEQVTNVMKQVNYNLDTKAGSTVAGSTMKVRIRAFSGIQEEMVIDDLVVQAASVLGVDDFDLTSNIAIYPNPSSDFILIETIEKDKKYTIYNSSAMEITKGTNLDNKIDIQNLKPGIYFLRFEGSNTIKFIKQ